MRDAHNKMSKRHGDPSYEDLKNQGFLTDAILNYVALLGWSPRGEEEMFSLAELEEVFDLSGMSKSPAIFDIEKLRHFNAEYIRAMTAEQFAEAAKPWIRISVQNESYDLSKIAALLQQRTEILSEIPEKVDFFDVLPEYGKELFVHKKSKSDESSSLEILQEIKPVFEAVSDWNNESLLNAMVTTAEKMEYKNAKVMWPVRIAVAGKAVTPGGSSEICEILGKEETLKRIEIAINLLKS
jgi:glutamyl-tRNA synthetase